MARVQRLRFTKKSQLASLLLLFLFVFWLPRPAAAEEKEKPWYERLQVRGYTQVRYSRIGASNPQLKNDQGDKSIGADGGILLRRARLILQGDLGSHVGLYFQPDFASAVEDALHIAQIRDLWADIFLDSQKSFRFRVGQQKVPYGWELMQSSSQRAPLDRSDGINSAFVNERDLGVFAYFETPTARKRYRALLDSGVKGSGDYGMTAIGFSNGQALNTRERNDNKHFFARVAYPFELGSQTVELGVAGYTGLYVPSVDAKSPVTLDRKNVQDYRVGGTFVLYPKPFGLQAEYNVGYGPERVGNTIEARPLDGGYVMAMYRVHTPIGWLLPYARLHRYDGGKKFFANAPRHEVRELNAGVEWQPIKWVELTAEYMESRRVVDGVSQAGRLLRLQLQFNY